MFLMFHHLSLMPPPPFLAWTAAVKTHDACQAAESKLAISLSNGVTAGPCWPLNCLWWRKQLLVVTLVWHCLLAARLFSASRSHFRLKSPFWQRRTLNAGDWSICCKIQGGDCLHTSCDSAGVPALSVVLGFVLEGPPTPPNPHFSLFLVGVLSLHNEF